MTHELPVISTLEELAATLHASHTQPTMLFKHSATCPISARALGEVRLFAETLTDGNLSGVQLAMVMVVVQDARAVSDEIAARTGVEHQSPQAILLVNGAPVWNDSHFGIKADRLQQAIVTLQSNSETLP